MANVLKIHAGSVYTRNGIIHEWISSVEGSDVFSAQGLEIKLYLGISIEARVEPTDNAADDAGRVHVQK